MQNDSQIAPKKIGAWFFILGLVGIALFLLASNLFLDRSGATTDPEDPARDVERVKNLAELQADDEKKLNSYAWVDQAKGSVQIPLNQAMTLVLAKLNSNKPKPAYPILDNAGNPVPSVKLAPPAVGANDDLPDNEPSAATGSNVLAAPVDKAPAKSGKVQKNSTQQ
jgi:hypothetical protein